MTFSIFLHVKPVPFARPRARGKRFFNAPKYDAFKTEIGWRLTNERKNIPLGILLPDPSVALFVEALFYFKIPASPSALFPTRGDVDNYLKALLDAGTGILWRDDDQIVSVSARKVYSTSDGISLRYGIQERAGSRPPPA